jgi:CrcB protein
VTRERDAAAHGVHWSAQLPVDPDVDKRDAAHPVAVIALVFVGGCVGGLLRYAVTTHWPDGVGAFPWATFGVNVAGAFVLAVVVELAAELHPRWVYLRPLLGAGLCGALTTFSSIVVSVDRLVAHGHATLAVEYLVATVAAGVAAGALGLAGTRWVAR